MTRQAPAAAQSRRQLLQASLAGAAGLAIWGSQNLKNLESHLDRLDKLAPNHRKHLGCYMWDYANKAPMPVERMKMQCELGLRWLREKRIIGMRFVANTLCDLDLPAVEWTRRWIAEVGDEPL